MNSVGPLHGYRIVELAGKGPAPLCGMLLGNMGADVIRIQRPPAPSEIDKTEERFSLLHRNRRSIALDLRMSAARSAALRIIATADGLIEGFRPGVMERLELGPEPCLAANPRLIYGRVTGWGQTGPLAHSAGHDINYLALSGALHTIGPRDGNPVAPLNLLADYGGGAMYLAFGLVCGLLEARTSGQGQVIDVAMTDAVASLMTAIHGLRNAGLWQERRGTNLLDGGSPFYGTHETLDGGHMAVGAIEPVFFKEFIQRLGLREHDFGERMNPTTWAKHHESIKARFRQKTRAEWERVFADSDACVTPVLSMAEATRHPHNAERRTFNELDGVMQPGVAPRFSRTPGEIRRPPVEPGQDGRSVLEEVGLAPQEIDALLSA